MTWHFIDSDWNLKSIPLCSLNIRLSNKTGTQLCSIMEEVLRSRKIVGSESITVNTVTTDNEAAVSKSADLLTNYVGSVRCVVHSLALTINDVFKEGKNWTLHVEEVNKVTSYFKYHQKAKNL